MIAASPTTTGQEALERVMPRGEPHVTGRAAAFVCPFPNCRVYAQHYWGYANVLGIYLGNSTYSQRSYGGEEVTFALCDACQQETVFVGRRMVWPIATEAPPPSVDLPVSLHRDYEEAAAIHKLSPRGAAALLRLLIQKLCVELGSRESDINSAIARFVSDGRINPAIQKALDAVRVIGNESVHPGTMDLRDDAATVRSMFGLVNFIVEKMISEPKEIDAIYNSLPPRKLDGIAKRDDKLKG